MPVIQFYIPLIKFNIKLSAGTGFDFLPTETETIQKNIKLNFYEND